MLTFTFTISVFLMIFTPVIIAVLLRRRYDVPWLLFLFGTLSFIASQVVHLPINKLLSDLGLIPQPYQGAFSADLVQTALVLGFTAGLCEETARWVTFRLLPKYRKIEDGVMLGLGHGGVESMIFGAVLTAATVSALIPLVNTDLTTLNLLPGQLSALQVQLDMLTKNPVVGGLAPWIERMMAMTIHVFLSVMVLQSFRRKNILYYIAAILYHMLIDAVAVMISTIYPNHYIALVALALMMVPGVIWLVITWRREASPPRVMAPPFSSELAAGMRALKKELLQQWRTRRVLVVMAVFVLFGLTSPILAYFLPEMMKSIPGAEQFSELIPVPTSADAMSQYIKNITQFGFILAILLGMSAVAGEKESGTAAMVLSKPMPRWAFIVSKYGAQAAVYLAAFVVAGLGAYFYTSILFGPFDPLIFATINLLLLAWLLVFVSAALLGSVIGSTTAAAAGIGLGIAVVFLLSGSIPQFGALGPGGLTTWASLLGAGTTPNVPANAGALAASLVLITLCLLWSIALFERQEI